jgi:prepilin-type N-terminal cleavage/methylation domain-containing protein
MNYQLKNSSGFTLIEVLIAIVLLAFISLYTFKMVDTNLDTKDQVLKEDRLLLQTLTAISRIDSDFNQIYSPLYSTSKENPSADSNQLYQDNSSPKGQFDGKAKNGILIPQFQSPDKSTLIFFTASNRRKMADAKDSRYNWVKYSIRRTDHSGEDAAEPKSTGDQELVRQTITTNIYSDDLNWSDVKAQVLLTNVKSVEFSFWDERTKKYVTSILELNENKNLIRSIKLNLVWIDEDNHEQKIEKNFRILFPFFNAKADDLKNGAYSGGAVPPGLPDPNQATGGEDEKHF